MVELSVVVPMYNEQEVLPLLVARLRPLLDGLDIEYEVLAVDDGSTDLPPALLQRQHREWTELRVVRLRANAGHQAAISAGLVAARGDYVVTIDADLQDPPEVIREMLEVARRDGVDVVYGVRNDRTSDTWFKRVSAHAFYRLIGAVSHNPAHADAGDFRLMSRATVDAINELPDHNRVLRFVVPALGFPAGTVTYKRDERAAGTSKYPLMKMVKLSLDSLTASRTSGPTDTPLPPASDDDMPGRVHRRRATPEPTGAGPRAGAREPANPVGPLVSPASRFAPRPTRDDLPDPVDGPARQEETTPRRG
jgi:dolichol-phosphate mannosyltransferase